MIQHKILLQPGGGLSFLLKLWRWQAVLRVCELRHFGFTVSIVIRGMRDATCTGAAPVGHIARSLSAKICVLGDYKRKYLQMWATKSLSKVSVYLKFAYIALKLQQKCINLSKSHSLRKAACSVALETERSPRVGKTPDGKVILRVHSQLLGLFPASRKTPRTH